MKRLFFILIVLVGLSAVDVVKAQEVNSELYTKDHVPNRKPIPYAHVREADVLWAKKIWRVIDLREKINLPMYYPTTQMDDRYNLIDLLIYGIQYEGLTAYSTGGSDEFQVPLTLDQVMRQMGAVSDTSMVKDIETGMFVEKIVEGEVRSTEIKQFMLKEIWFFDSKYSRMDVRIVGLCPIREYVSEEGGEGNVRKSQTFWIYFPEARGLFARHEVFNPRNDAQRRTFDDIFIKRYFGSYIYKEANVYDNRRIEDYTAGMEAMMESERIKQSIFEKEHDMWEF
ncbi:gliding motility protein GldN [Carboxylicivirga sp. M1479]|uniref:type IX secretion system ring protein PorN/GldN n=1 Tax=Carboxylicivirga sp. M1479 TaxID=2594476 RepID=UPI0011775C54|nr:gliding motility protein GldN [Carboxylicivirga sp. M1479]TRX61579.1 gliding motility protein GldN [Carboxylicivirga sp. M1479]